MGTWYLNTWCYMMNGTAAILSSDGSMRSGIYDSRVLIMVTEFVDKSGRTISGVSDSEQVRRQRENVRCEVVQLTSGLCAFNQSVPRIMSWVLIAVM
jgi:hypothetical protein